jgi:hypothetical protein
MHGLYIAARFCRDLSLGDEAPSVEFKDDRPRYRHKALYGKLGFAQALDSVRVLAGVPERQDAPPPLDRKIRSNPQDFSPSRPAFVDLAKVTVAGGEQSVARLRIRFALEAQLEGCHRGFELPQ